MSYPDIKDNNFYDKITKKFSDYKIPKKNKEFDEICFPKEFKLQIPQKFLAKYINPRTQYTGALMFYRIGAGKTCAAVQICEAWKKKRKIIVVVPASLKNNFRTELRSLCAGEAYLKNDERKLLQKLHPTDEKYQEIIKRSDERIDEYYQIYSNNKFVELAEEKKISLRKSLLIIDEIQNMVSEKGKFYKVLNDTIHNAPKDLRIVVMTATPMFDKPNEIALTMNLLRIPFELPTGREFDKEFINIVETKDGKFTYIAKNLDIFKERIKGYVSYFRGAPPYVFPELTVKFVKCEMSSFQYRAYLTVMRDEDRAGTFKNRYKIYKSGEIAELPNNFFIGTRLVSNVVYPNKKVGEEGLKSFEGKHITKYLDMYSTKFARIMRKIKNSSGKVFVYSAFKGFAGIKSFIRVLEELGYKNYWENGEGRKRFAVISGDESINQKEEIKTVFNMAGNNDGHKLRILLGTPATAEGFSFFSVRQIHILEPHWNVSMLSQIIGRGSRFCSHKNLPEEERNIKVYVYMATHPNEDETVDQYINFLATQKNKIINEFEQALKEASIDCNLFKNANVFKGENDIICEH